MKKADVGAGGRRAVACDTEQTQLGEGVRWDARRDELLHLDILAGRVFRNHVASDGDLVRVAVYDVPGTVGAIAPIKDDDGSDPRCGARVRLPAPRWISSVAPPTWRLPAAA